MRWRARYVSDDGHEYSKVFARKVDAQAWLDNEITPALATGTHVTPGSGRVTVRSVYTSWSASQSHVSAKTAATRRSAWGSRVAPQWADVPVVDVKTSAVRAWVAKMAAEEVGAATIENAFGLLRQVLGAAVEDRRIPRNPCEGVKLPKRKHADRGYLSHGQVAALAAAVDRHPEVVRFLSYTGLRWGEMAALRVGDFDMLRRRVNVSRSVTESGGLVWSTPKTWERRSVPLPAVLADELAALMVGKGRDELVFTDLRGGVLRNSNWRARVFEPAVTTCQKADDSFPSITPHDLRHTAASLAVSAGANVKAVQRMLGHAKASMTLDVYADLFDTDLDDVAANLEAAIKAHGSTVVPAISVRDQSSPGR
jgi:integrase